MELKFDPVEHRYTLDGAAIPGVNELFTATGIKDDSFYKPGMADKGKAVHRLVEAINNGEDFEVKPEYKGYFQAYTQWLCDNDIEIIQAERQAYHKYYHYAGTIDLVCKINGRDAIVDIKTGQKNRWHELQLIAYGLIVESWEGNRPELYAMYLKEDGYKIEEYTYHDMEVVTGALRIWKWRNR